MNAVPIVMSILLFCTGACLLITAVVLSHLWTEFSAHVLEYEEEELNDLTPSPAAPPNDWPEGY